MYVLKLTIKEARNFDPKLPTSRVVHDNIDRWGEDNYFLHYQCAEAAFKIVMFLCCCAQTGKKGLQRRNGRDDAFPRVSKISRLVKITRQAATFGL